MKTQLTAAGLVCAASLAAGISAADASTIDVTVPNYGTIQVATLDWNPGNALAKGAIPLSDGQTFDLYFQASLGNLIGTNGTQIPVPGLGTQFEVTVIGGFSEKVVNVSTGGGMSTATFTRDYSPNTLNFFQIYFDETVDANNLAGTGFNDGTLVASGYVSQANGGFTVYGLNSQTFGNLDQFGNNDWPNTYTLSGAGGTNAMVHLDNIDSAMQSYFSFGGNTYLQFDLAFNTSNILPYLQVDPSKQFTDENGNLFSPSVGTVNGLSGPDMLFQADANSSAVVPEPSTIALVGAGLLGMGLFARRRAKK